MSDFQRKKIESKAIGWLSLALPTAATLALVMTAAPVRAADLNAAASNFSDSCADCHGKAGKGDGPKAAELKTKPANYTDCASMGKFDDDYLFKIVKQGGEAVGKSKEMPDFGKAYDDDEIHGLLAYVRTFCKK
jgi:mono/diheme cytochrome c family protein